MGAPESLPEVSRLADAETYEEWIPLTPDGGLIERQLAELELAPEIGESFWVLAGSGYAPEGFDSTTYFEGMDGPYGDDR